MLRYELWSAMMCVKCTSTDHAACTGTTPACGSDYACHGCKAHSDCTSNACLPDGSCGDDANVAYVDPAGTDNTTCAKATPCTKVAKALATTRPYVKFHGTTGEAVTITNQNVTLLADHNSKLTRTTAGVILNIDGTSNVKIYNLEIANALGANGVGISLPTGNTATLELVRARVDNNAGGGVSISGGSFLIVGNVFFNNGGNSSLIGGVAIATAQNSTNRLEFNSFNKNTTQDGIGPAIQCMAGTFAAKNNIMSGNGTLTQMDQVGGTCTHAYSIARPGTVPGGTGNIASDPSS